MNIIKILETSNNKNLYNVSDKLLIGLGVPTMVGGAIYNTHRAYKKYKNATASPSEKAQAIAGSVKDVIKNKIMEHPKTAAAAGAASAIGAGYGAYKYLKNRKKR